MIRLIRALFSRPTTQPDVPSPLDVEDVWGWGGGLTRGQRAFLLDQGNLRVDVDSVDATVRAANGVRR